MKLLKNAKKQNRSAIVERFVGYSVVQTWKNSFVANFARLVFGRMIILTKIDQMSTGYGILQECRNPPREAIFCLVQLALWGRISYDDWWVKNALSTYF